MVADMLHAIPVLAVVEALIFDFPATLGHAVEAQAAQRGYGKVGQPFGLDHRTVAFVLAIAQHAHGAPAKSFPRIEVVGIPNLDSVISLLVHDLRRLAIKT